MRVQTKAALVLCCSLDPKYYNRDARNLLLVRANEMKQFYSGDMLLVDDTGCIEVLPAVIAKRVSRNSI